MVVYAHHTLIRGGGCSFQEIILAETSPKCNKLEGRTDGREMRREEGEEGREEGEGSTIFGKKGRDGKREKFARAKRAPLPERKRGRQGAGGEVRGWEGETCPLLL